MDPNIKKALQRGNKVVFFDVKIGTLDIGRIKMELFYDVTPKVSLVRKNVVVVTCFFYNLPIYLYLERCIIGFLVVVSVSLPLSTYLHYIRPHDQFFCFVCVFDVVCFSVLQCV